MFFAVNVRKPAPRLRSRWRPAWRSSTTRSSRRTSPRSCSPTSTRTCPRSQRPLVENNILGRQKHALCDVARTFTNVIVSGAGCPGDRSGNPHLDAAGPPDRGLRGAARGRHRERRAGDRSQRAQARRSRPPSAPTSCPDRPVAAGTARSSSVRRHGDLQRRPHAHARGDVHDRARHRPTPRRSCGPRSGTAGTSAAARARPTIATASRSRRRARSSTARASALGDDPFALEAIEARLRARGGSVVGCCAVECALHDLVGKLVGPADLAPARARRPHARDRRTRSASTRSRARPTARARAAEAGYRRLKIKLGGEGDLERLDAIRARLRPAPARRRQRGLEPRRGAPRCCRPCVELGVELIEQPFPAGERDAFRALRGDASGIPLVVDEGCHTLARRRRRRHLRRRRQSQARQDRRHPRGACAWCTRRARSGSSSCSAA